MEPKDKLEERIQALRKSGKNELKPAPELWNRIERELPSQKPESGKQINFTNYLKPLAVAASFALFLTAAFILGRSSGVEDGREEAFADLESRYMDSIGTFKNELENFQILDVGLKNQFNDDITDMDSTYADLKRTIEESADPEKVRKAMIRNLTLRIRLLQQQLHILNDIKKTQETHEKII